MDCSLALFDGFSSQQKMHLTAECIDQNRKHKPVLLLAILGPLSVLSLVVVLLKRKCISKVEAQSLSTSSEQQNKINMDVGNILPASRSSGFWHWESNCQNNPKSSSHCWGAGNNFVQRADEKYDGLLSTQKHLVKMVFSNELLKRMAPRSSMVQSSCVGRSSTSIGLPVEITNKVVGRGDYGVVREGIMRSPEYLEGDQPKRVAVKQMEATRATNANHASTAEALQHELMVFQRIKLHKNVVRFYGGWIEPNGQVNIVEELLHCNLVDLIHNSRRMAKCTYLRLLRIFLDIVDGVLHLHASNVIHHDLKPSNVLLNQSFTQAKISDFGCSRLKLRTLMNASMLGTVGYLPLECLMSFLKVPVQPEKIDVFSIGVIMWESITGNTPPNPFNFELEVGSGNGKGSVHSSLSSLSGLSDSERFPFPASVPGDLCELVWSCLSLDVSDRSSLREVRENLKKISMMPWSKELPRP